MIVLIKKIAIKILEQSVYSANKENGRLHLLYTLKKIVPDVTKQYTTFNVDTPHLMAMVRALHAFQVSLVQKVWEILDKKDINIVDIGDSSGAHLMYLQAADVSGDRVINATSVNLDSHAVNKIKSKGLNAIECRAEDLVSHPEYEGKNVDILLSFETLEHLFDPISFMKSISDSVDDAYFIVTVPYMKKSRVALHQIRQESSNDMYAENTHIFELCPEDWNLIFKLSGWEIVYGEVFRLFPKKNILWVASILWKKFAFDGHYGCVLKKNNTYKNKYKSW